MIRRYGLSIVASAENLGPSLRSDREDTLTDSGSLVSSSHRSKHIYKVNPFILFAGVGEKIVFNIENDYSERAIKLVLRSHDADYDPSKDQIISTLKRGQSFKRAVRCNNEGVLTLSVVVGRKKDGRHTEKIVGALIALPNNCAKTGAQRLVFPPRLWVQQVTSNNAEVVSWLAQYASIGWSDGILGKQSSIQVIPGKPPEDVTEPKAVNDTPALKQYGGLVGQVRQMLGRFVKPTEKVFSGLAQGEVGTKDQDGTPTVSGHTAVSRHLTAETQGHVKLAETFSLKVQVSSTARVSAPGIGSAPIKDFAGKLEVDVIAPGFQILNGSIKTLEVPAVGDSDPLRFLLKAEKEGKQVISVTAYNGAAYITGIKIEITVGEAASLSTPQSGVSAVVMRQPRPEEGLLIVSFDEREKCYCFRFRFGAKEYPTTCSAPMLGAKQEVISGITGSLNSQARNLKNFSSAQSLLYMKGLGASLYRELIPLELKQALWQVKGDMQCLNIISPADTMPWEMLYVSHPETEIDDEGGFLADLTTVVRWINGNNAAPAQLYRAPAYVVIPPGAPRKAHQEFSWVFAACGKAELVTDLDALLALTQAGKFRWLHFAAHNEMPTSGITTSYVPFGKGKPSFELMFMSSIPKDLYSVCQPLVFMNACTSASSRPLFTEMVGWADSFVRCGAAAFVGSFWEVRDESAAKFAQAFYTSLQSGSDLGQAMASGRQSLDPGDPTYLAYTLYGNPSALLQ